MSNASSKPDESAVAVERPPAKAYGRIPRVPWNPWLGVIFIIGIFYASQIFSGVIVLIYPWTQHWNTAQANGWLNESVWAQFFYILLSEAIMIGAIFGFLRLYTQKFNIIGLLKPRWRDLGFGLLGALAYYLLYLFVVIPIVTHFVPSLNVNQQQDIGFSHVHGLAQLTITFISLAILPPLAEEIMARGFLYSSWRKATPRIVAVVLTSLMFAAPHLLEGGGGGLLYIAGVDTFVLSVVLISLREKTGSLWAGVTVHTIKNSIAFMTLFLIGVH